MNDDVKPILEANAKSALRALARLAVEAARQYMPPEDVEEQMENFREAYQEWAWNYIEDLWELPRKLQSEIDSHLKSKPYCEGCGIMLDPQANNEFCLNPYCEFAAPKDPEACPGCERLPGDGISPNCNHPNGCGFWREEQKKMVAREALQKAHEEAKKLTYDDFIIHHGSFHLDQRNTGSNLPSS